MLKYLVCLPFVLPGLALAQTTSTGDLLAKVQDDRWSIGVAASVRQSCRSSLPWSASLTREELVEEVVELQAGLRNAAGGALRLDLPAEVGNVYDAMPRDAAFWVTDATTGRTVASSRPGPALQALMELHAAAPAPALACRHAGGATPARHAPAQ